MKEISEENIRMDAKKWNAYKEYKKYEGMLKIYERSKSENGISIIRNSQLPFALAEKIAEKYGFSFEEYMKFSDRLDVLKNKNPEIELNDISTRKGREVIGDIISECHDVEKFSAKDLESVAVAKYYGLYKSVADAKGKENNEIVNILRENQVPIGTFEQARTDVKRYEQTGIKEMYDEYKGKKLEDIVYVASAILEIGPGEAEDNLKDFNVIKGRKSEFEKDIDPNSLRFVSNKATEDLEEKCLNALSGIALDRNITLDQKKELMKEQYKILNRIKNEKEEHRLKNAQQIDRRRNRVSKYLSNEGDVNDLSKETRENNGIPRTLIVDDERDIG